MSRPHETTAALASDQKSDEVTAAKPRGLGIILCGMILAIVLICAYWLIWYGIDRNLLA